MQLAVACYRPRRADLVQRGKAEVDIDAARVAVRALVRLYIAVGRESALALALRPVAGPRRKLAARPMPLQHQFARRHAPLVAAKLFSLGPVAAVVAPSLGNKHLDALRLAVPRVAPSRPVFRRRRALPFAVRTRETPLVGDAVAPGPTRLELGQPFCAQPRPRLRPLRPRLSQERLAMAFVGAVPAVALQPSKFCRQIVATRRPRPTKLLPLPVAVGRPTGRQP